MTVVAAVVLTVVVLGAVDVALDFSHAVLVRTQLQVAADSLAVTATREMNLPRDEMLRATQRQARRHAAAGRAVGLDSGDIEYGVWNSGRRTFTPSHRAANAVRVTTSADGSPPFFGMVLSRLSFARRTSAVAMADPCDVVFVVDLSGSINDDTEPCWATDAVDELYEDFGFGPCPGELQRIGAPWDLSPGRPAYAELAADDGPLGVESVPLRYRIRADDDELTRKHKVYSAIIDLQLARIMPAAKPVPDSVANFAYWEKYLDYVIRPIEVGTGDDRTWLPPLQDVARIDRFNNPNPDTYPGVSSSALEPYRDKIGYLTYVQFMLDHGRDLKPVAGRYVPLSKHSGDCPWHEEDTAGGRFRFPPRTQPMHAVRLALIAAVQTVKQHNAKILDPQRRDWVSIVAYDSLASGGPSVEHRLSADYDSAMAAVAGLQAVGERGDTTATDSAMILAGRQLDSKQQGGPGRPHAKKVVVLLTDGVPNLYADDPAAIERFIDDNPGGEFYGHEAHAHNATLMRAILMRKGGRSFYPVGVGLGADYEFLDRLARAAGTADDDGQSARAIGDPAGYEQRLTEVVRAAITNPPVRLVE